MGVRVSAVPSSTCKTWLLLTCLLVSTVAGRQAGRQAGPCGCGLCHTSRRRTGKHGGTHTGVGAPRRTQLSSPPHKQVCRQFRRQFRCHVVVTSHRAPCSGLLPQEATRRRPLHRFKNVRTALAAPGLIPAARAARKKRCVYPRSNTPGVGAGEVALIRFLPLRPQPPRSALTPAFFQD